MTAIFFKIKHTTNVFDRINKISDFVSYKNDLSILEKNMLMNFNLIRKKYIFITRLIFSIFLLGAISPAFSHDFVPSLNINSSNINYGKDTTTFSPVCDTTESKCTSSKQALVLSQKEAVVRTTIASYHTSYGNINYACSTNKVTVVLGSFTFKDPVSGISNSMEKVRFQHNCTGRQSSYKDYHYWGITRAIAANSCGLNHVVSSTSFICEHVNQAPIFQSFNPPTTILAGETYNYRVQAIDLDAYPDASITYSISGAPSWLSFNAGLLTGVAPITNSISTISRISISISDGPNSPRGITVTETFNLTVSLPPFGIYGAPPSRVEVNTPYSFIPNLRKPTGSSVTIRSTGSTLPIGLAVNSTTGAITGSPTVAGNYTGLVLTATNATDNTTVSLKSFSIVVNGPPKAVAGGPYSVEINLPLSFKGSASDPNGDAISYKWDFGDNSTSTQLSPKHTYTNGGNFTATLTVTENASSKLSTVAQTSVKVVLYDPGLNAGLQSESIVCGVADPKRNNTNPINAATGNKVQTETDYVGVGVFPLSFVRYYSSESSINADLGQHWRHSYLRSIELDTSVTPNIAKVKRADGTIVKFEQNGTAWKARAGIQSRLESTAMQWRFYTGSDQIETYSITSGNLISQISKITNRAGFTQTFIYVNGKLSKITDHFGRTLQFAYLNGRIDTITDPSLKTIKYNYLNDNLESVTYQDASTRHYQYTNPTYPNHLTGIIDQNGKLYASWSYDAQGRAKSSTHAGNANHVSLVYNANDTTTLTDALGTARTYSYVTVNGALKVSNIAGPACNVCGGGSKNNKYDTNGYLDIVTDFKGNVTDYNFNARGLIEQRIEAKGTPDQRTTQTVWDTKFNIPACVIASRNTTANVYTAKGQIQSRTVYDTTDTTLFSTPGSKACDAINLRTDLASINKSTTTYIYYTNGLLKTVDGPLPGTVDITRYAYDIKGNLNTITNATQHVTTLQDYDAHGRPQTIIDANGLTTTITYDLLGQKDIVTVGSEVTDYNYYPNGTLDKVTLPDGSFLDYRYDDAQRLTDIYDQLGNHTQYTLNDLGSRMQTDTSDPTGLLKRTQSAVYDLENRLKKVIGAANQTTNYLAYDPNGNLKQVQDPGLNNSAFTYDALDRLKTSTDAKLGVTTNAYDAQNNLTSVTDPRGLVTSYSYDGLGNRTQTVSPDTGTTIFTSYDPTGNVLSMTNALGKTTMYQYDAIGRLDLVTYQDGTTTDYVYDVGLNAKGRLTSIVYNGGATSFAGTIVDSWTYDKHGRVLSKTQTNGTVVLTTLYTYDVINGNLKTETTPGNHKIVYSYLNGQVDSISVDSQKVMNNISYDPFGPPTSWDFGNGTTISRVYNKDGQLFSYPEADVILTNTYFPTGNLKNVKENGTAATIFDNEYTYDKLNRVITWKADANTEGYLYDANSNRTSQTINLLSYTSTIASTSNQLSSRTGSPLAKAYSYDLAGNTTGDGIHTYGYDDRGRLTSLDLKAIEYAINGLGQRIRKRGGFDRDGDLDEDGVVNNNDRIIIEDAVAGNITAAEIHDRDNNNIVNQADVTQFDNMVNNGNSSENFAFDERFVYNSQGQLEGEYDGAGNVVQEYIWFAGMPVALLRGGEIFYIDTDHLGTPISVSDQSQSVIWEWDPEPYGRALPDVDFDGDRNLFVINLRFPGQYYDHESGLHYNINRFYDPSTGRYLESDPIGLAGGLNTYGYVGGNPVNWGDPYGLAPENVVSMDQLKENLTTYPRDWWEYIYSAPYVCDASGNCAQMAGGEPFGGPGIIVNACKGVAKSGSILANASSSAFKAAGNIAGWIPKNKHLLGTAAKRSAKFNTNSVSDVRSIVGEALRSPNAKFLPNNVDGSFRVVTDLGRQVGSKGQTSVRVIVGNDGKIWNSFPVNTQ